MQRYNYRNEGNRACIVFDNPRAKGLDIVFIYHYGVITRRVKRDELRYMVPQDAKVLKSARQMLKSGARLGISTKAKFKLNEVLIT